VSETKPSPMGLAQIIAMMRDHAKAWAMECGCHLRVGGSAWHVLELLAAAPVGLLAIVWWGGDEETSGTNGLARNQLNVVLARNRGLTENPTEHLTDAGPAGSRPLFELVDGLRSHLLACEWPTDITDGLFYRGCEPFVSPEGAPLDAYQISFALAAEMPVPERIAEITQEQE
jgi:hypothetical protein